MSEISKLGTDPYKGVRDFYPEDQFVQNYIFDTWRKAAESFGYEEYNASLLEPTEIYTEKSGEEIVNEQTFTFSDRGGRSVTLRPEMTPTLVRMIAARRRELAFPLRWYSIPNLFRYEATQRGRLREHWQLNLDLFGISNLNGDLEVIIIADKIMKNFGAKPGDYEIKLACHSPEYSLEDAVRLLNKNGIRNTKVDSELKRGQTYYTGIVFEFFDTNPVNPRSILGGGRYDNLTDLFSGEDGNSLPAVGFGAGDVTIRDFLETRNLLPNYEPKTQIYIALISEAYSGTAEKLAEEFRNDGWNTAIDWSERKIGDQIRTAGKDKIPYLIVVGKEEASTKTFKLKNMSTGQEIFGSIESLKLELKKQSNA